MRTLLSVHSYKAAEARVRQLHPHWDVGWDILGVNTIGGEHWWPEHVRQVSIGEETEWINPEKLAPGYQPKRFLDTIRFFLTDEGCRKYSHIFFMHQDCIFPRRPPQIPIRFLTTIGGECPPHWGVTSKLFLHVPYWLDRNVASKMLKTGDEMVKNGQFENSSEDVFVGSITDKIRVNVQTGKTWSCNSRDMRVRWPEAHAAVQSGVWFLHGILEPEQLGLVLNGQV